MSHPPERGEVSFIFREKTENCWKPAVRDELNELLSIIALVAAKRDIPVKLDTTQPDHYLITLNPLLGECEKTWALIQYRVISESPHVLNFCLLESHRFPQEEIELPRVDTPDFRTKQQQPEVFLPDNDL